VELTKWLTHRGNRRISDRHWTVRRQLRLVGVRQHQMDRTMVKSLRR